MSKVTLLAAAAAALCLAGTVEAQMAQTAPTAGDPMTAPTMALDYVKDAGASDMFEIQSSKLVLQSTHDPKVRTFANKMIADHTKSTAMIKAAASKDQITVPAPMLMPMQQQMLDDIRAAKGKSRDAVYLQDQATAHKAALMVHQSYAQGGDKPALMAVAGNIVPVVQSHIAMLENGGSMASM